MRALIIGGGGPVGAIMAEALDLAGVDTMVSSRSGTARGPALDVLDVVDRSLLSGVDAVFYNAWNSADRRWVTQRAHADAAIRWASACKEVGVRFVFASSTLADEDAYSAYGRSKFRAEEGVRAAGGLSLRIGLVCDDAHGLLSTGLRRNPVVRVVPARFLGVPVFPVSGAYLGQVVVRCLLDELRPGVYWVATRHPVTLSKVIHPSATRDGSPKMPSAAVRFVVRRVARLGSIVGALDRLAGIIGGPREIPDTTVETSLLQADTMWTESLFS